MGSSEVSPTAHTGEEAAVYEGADAGARVVGTTAPGALGNVYLETFGCQMNESDTEIVTSILRQAGYGWVTKPDEADVILTNTCAVREHAEDKVWARLGVFKSIKRRRLRTEGKPVVGVLGCMAERLKTKLLESDMAVDIVAGPDSYRDLPRLIAIVRGGDVPAAVNVQLSQDETYADIRPVRADAARVAAFVSIMRGCNNMCSFCIVPFTRGRERSRNAATIEAEVRRLAEEGVREVTLLGQNVNSYHDAATPAGTAYTGRGYAAADGFNNMFRARDGDGVRFTELLDRLSAAVPEVRIRFTSPHPKDFPDELLHLMRERRNICRQIHMPAQSGATSMLARMRRGYTREAYLALAHRIRALLPGVALSSDFISGFCGETAEEHAQTLSLMREVRFEQAFMFAYSRRERTHAAYKLEDDVPQALKLARLQEVIDTYRDGVQAANDREVGTVHLLLLEGDSKRSTAARRELTGRTDNNKRCVFPADALVAPSLASLLPTVHGASVDVPGALPASQLQPGEYVAVRITASGTSTLQAMPLARTSIAEFFPWHDAAFPPSHSASAASAAAATSSACAEPAAHAPLT
ncbi:MiaB/RimO family radical SAM methylthiotransferase [archaeon]|nr:MAG: MiaB/RimO family radical SAM methylthiotransferase [archaeon]